jgi:hypothetical protein
MKNRKPKSKAKLFDPDKISNRINQEISADFESFKQMYKGNDPITTHAFTRQKDELLKKYVSTDKTKKDLLHKKAISDFQDINLHMGTINAKLKNFDLRTNFRISNSDSFLLKVLKRSSSIIDFVLGDFEMEEFFDECKNSSGMTIGVPFMDTSNDSKFRYPISVTSDVKPLAELYLQFDKKLELAIQHLNKGNIVADRYEIVDGSVATTVDKKDDQRRFITLVPTWDMFFQQALMRMMYKRMRSFGLDVASLPDIHKELARYSSIHCLNATIDWSSASDCVSFELLKLEFPPKWFELVKLLRSDYIVLSDDLIVEANMISTMGNAGTFPIETLIFWAHAVATITTLKSTTNSRLPEIGDFKKASVFGDDCILPSSVAPQYIEVMEEIGFIINDEKSFYDSEQFRESCGGDYLQGYDVRPFYLKAPSARKKSALEPWLYIILNSLLKKYFVYFGETNYVYDKCVLKYIFSLFSGYKIKLRLVPSHFPDDAGLKMSCDIERLVYIYRIRLEKIHMSHHGTVRFTYCRYRYPQKEFLNQEIRYWDNRKRLKQADIEPMLYTPTRKRGGYVVGRSTECHWYPPSILGSERRAAKKKYQKRRLLNK